MSHSTSFSGTVEFVHPDTDEVFYIQYEGVYEPACNRGHIDNWTPDESYLDLLDLPSELEWAEDRIKKLAWQDVNS